MAAAARALAWLQATGGGATPPPEEGAVAAGARAAVHWAQVRRYLCFALAAYGHLALKLLGVLPRLGGPATDEAGLEHLTGVAAVDLVYSDWAGSTYRPGHLLAIDHEARAVVLAVRGTMRLHDVLTDLVCEHVALGGEAGGAGEAGEAGEAGDVGEAHAGMLEAAQRLLEQQRPLLEATLRLTFTLTLTLPLTLTFTLTLTLALTLPLTRRRCACTPATPSSSRGTAWARGSRRCWRCSSAPRSQCPRSPHPPRAPATAAAMMAAAAAVWAAAVAAAVVATAVAAAAAAAAVVAAAVVAAAVAAARPQTCVRFTAMRTRRQPYSPSSMRVP